jgi:hypothetical protein
LEHFRTEFELQLGGDARTTQDFLPGITLAFHGGHYFLISRGWGSMTVAVSSLGRMGASENDLCLTKFRIPDDNTLCDCW